MKKTLLYCHQPTKFVEFSLYLLSVIHEKLINAYNKSHKYKNIKPLSKHYHYIILYSIVMLFIRDYNNIIILHSYIIIPNMICAHTIFYFITQLCISICLFFFLNYLTDYNNIIIYNILNTLYTIPIIY